MLSNKWKGKLFCVLIGNRPTSSGWGSLLASTAAAGDDENSFWSTEKLEHTNFDEWMKSTEAQDISFEINKVLRECRAVSPDNLRKRRPPEHSHDHHILLVPGKRPAKSAIYRMAPD